MWSPDQLPLPRFLPRTTPLLITLQNKSKDPVSILAEEWRPLSGALIDSLSAELEAGSSLCFSVQAGCQLLLSLDNGKDRYFLQQPGGGLPSWTGGGRLISYTPRELVNNHLLPKWSLTADIVSEFAPLVDVLRGIPATVTDAIAIIKREIPSATAFANAWMNWQETSSGLLSDEGPCTILVAMLSGPADYLLPMSCYAIDGAALFFEAGSSQTGSEQTLDKSTIRYAVTGPTLEGVIFPRDHSLPSVRFYCDARRSPIRTLDRRRILYIVQGAVCTSSVIRAEDSQKIGGTREG